MFMTMVNRWAGMDFYKLVVQGAFELIADSYTTLTAAADADAK